MSGHHDQRAIARPTDCEFRFHAELNDFLPRTQRNIALPYRFRGTPAVKDAMEALGVPHTEVMAIVVDGISRGFAYKLRGGERIDVYPESLRPAVRRARRLQRAPPRTLRFVADVHLGTLARYLRLLGFDTLYDRNGADAELLRQSVGGRRILLSRDVGLLKRGALIHGYFVRSTAPDLQIDEVVRRYELSPRIRAFTRCLACNGRLRRVSAASVASEVPPGARRTMQRFMRCEACLKVYWPGTHFERLRQIVERNR